ncbi:MAG: 4Fe-4S dicluster domain-containing protein [Chloroflexota bacterium]|nr:MAG: 4Fe-4S dicluster domain-containing protein [Chloroflexota bacterium]
MADLLPRTAAPGALGVPASPPDAVAERLLETQAPQRPVRTPAIRLEIDGRLVEGKEGQTILEVCRDNGIEIPTLCYEPKLPGFGACRMCVVEVEGEDKPPISCHRAAEPGMVVQTQTAHLRRLRKTSLELIFSDHNAYCLPPCQNKCPSRIDIPGFLKANTEGNPREGARIFKRTIPFPSILGRVCPAPCEDHCRRDEVDEAIAIRDSHRWHGDEVLKAQRETGERPPVPFEVKAPSGKRVAVVGSGPTGAAAGYYLALEGHEVTIYERDPLPGGMLRYGIPAYRLPKEEIVDGEYEAVTDLGVKFVCDQALGKDFTIDDLQNQGFDAVVVAIGCYATNTLGVPGEDAPEVLDGLEYLRIATLGLPYPGHKGKRVIVIGGGFTSMDCTRTSIRQGAAEVTLVYRRDMKDMPAAAGPYEELHGALEEGATAIFQASPVRVLTDDKKNVTGVEFIRMALGEPDASGRRRPIPVDGTEFTLPCDRVLLAIGQAPELDWLEHGASGITATNRHRLAGDAVTFATGRPGVFASGDARIGASTVVQAVAEGRRAAYAVDAYLRGHDLEAIKTRQTLAEPEPIFLSIVPFSAEVKEARYRLKAMAPEVRKQSYVEYELPYSREDAMAESKRCLQCTCEAIGFCDLRREGIEYGTILPTLEPARTGLSFRSVTENRFTGYNHDYIRDDSHAFILREPSRCIDCGRCARVCDEIVGAACYDFMRKGIDTLVVTPLDMSLNDTTCVSCGRCAETCPTGALMPKPRILEQYEVDESRCILCGICVDACPYDALRCGPDWELSHDSRAEPMIDLLAIGAIDRRTEVTYIQEERDWLTRARASGRDLHLDKMLPVLPAGVAGGNGLGSGHGNGHGNPLAADGNGHGPAAGGPPSAP